jgi:hypothetical protein
VTPEDFSLYVLGALADIRTALWSLVAAVGTLSGAVLTHALLTRKRKR